MGRKNVKQYFTGGGKSKLITFGISLLVLIFTTIIFTGCGQVTKQSGGNRSSGVPGGATPANTFSIKGNVADAGEGENLIIKVFDFSDDTQYGNVNVSSDGSYIINDLPTDKVLVVIVEKDSVEIMKNLVYGDTEGQTKQVDITPTSTVMVELVSNDSMISEILNNSNGNIDTIISEVQAIVDAYYDTPAKLDQLKTDLDAGVFVLPPDIIDSLETIIANNTYKLTISLSPVSSGSVSPNVGTHTYIKDAKVTLQAFGNAGWIFENWSGDLTGSNNPREIIMNDNKTVIANMQAVVLSHITVTPPSKTKYYMGEALVTAGMAITGYYNNGTNVPITEYTISGFDSDKTGTKTITVTAEGKSAIFTVEVMSVFDLTVKVSNSTGLDFILPIRDLTVNDLYIDWGDENTLHYTGTPASSTGVPHVYAQEGTYTIKLSGHTYFTGPYNSLNGGALGFGFSTGGILSGYHNDDNKQKLIGISGNLTALLGDYNPSSKDYMFVYTFFNCTNLTGEIPKNLFTGINAPAQNMFLATFYHCGFTAISGNLFAGITGAPVESLFSATFASCSRLTSIPAGLFGSISGAPAKEMFDYTFGDCSGLTSIPAGLFGSISGAPAYGMFCSTFESCSGLTSIPAGLFGSISGATAEAMFSRTFYNCSDLTGPSAILANGKKLYEEWPEATTEEIGDCYYDAIGLSDYASIPAAWK